MKEIGGYFQLDQFINKPYHENLVEINTGRNALLYLVKAKKIRKVHLPHYLCSSVSDLLTRHKIDHEFYLVDHCFQAAFPQPLKNDEFLYIVNYYGQISDETILEYKDKYKNIILDHTQAFFQKPLPGIDTIYSCRKYFGVPDGAYLSTDVLLNEELEEDLSGLRMQHILGRFEAPAADYYPVFKKNDASFKELPLKRMSKLTRNILGAIDYGKIIESRNRNFMYLHENLRLSNNLDIRMPYGAYAYPYFVENGMEIRKKLAGKKIYIPVLWPDVLANNRKGSVEYDFAADVLPLPCDQRYGIQDMKIVIEEVLGV